MPLELGLFLFCLLMSAFFSGSETAFLSSSRLRLRRLADEGDTKAERVLELVHDPRRLLAGILVGNNIFNVLAAGVAASYCEARIGRGSGLAVATVVTTVMLVVFSEFLPKTIAAVRPIAFARRTVRAVRAALTALAPVVRPLEAITRPLGALVARKSGDSYGLAELRLAVAEGVRTGVVDSSMERILRGGLSLEWKKVADILIPRVDVCGVDAGAAWRTCLEAFRSERYSRLLVMEETPDSDLGYLAAKDLFVLEAADREGWTARDGARKALRVPAGLPVVSLMAEMRKSGVHFAVVKDEYGGTEGIVTLEDVLEELVGEIRDEHDAVELPPVRELSPGVWAVRGEVSVRELEDRLGVAISAEDARTIGGLVAEELGRVPREKDVVEREGVRIVVVRTEDNRVLEVHLVRLP